MDVFLIGFGIAAPTYVSGDFGAGLAAPGHGARLIRDWSSLTADDTRWGVVVDAPNALSIRAAADELGLEIRRAIRLVPDRPLTQLGGDWAATLLDVLPSDPPPPLEQSIQEYGGSSEIRMTLLPDVKACGICGWIGGHDPAVPHPRSS
jgi:hypothetical protein